MNYPLVYTWVALATAGIIFGFIRAPRVLTDKEFQLSEVSRNEARELIAGIRIRMVIERFFICVIALFIGVLTLSQAEGWVNLPPRQYGKVLSLSLILILVTVVGSMGIDLIDDRKLDRIYRKNYSDEYPDVLR